MGNGVTKEEQLYQAVQNGNQNTVKSLRRDGASLEFVDKEGRTPLILACTRGDLFEMVLTLLNLGANIKVYRPGTHGGTPLHHAAKRGLDKTCLLLLSRGADPLALNDDSLTPLDMARNRGHVAVVRMIEDHICLFSGLLRELSGPGFLETLAPQWVTKKIWVVVLPTETDPRRTPKYELVVYQSPKVPLPRSIISLAKAEMEEPKFSSLDPVLLLTDRNTKSKYKFLAETEGDKSQLERFYKACKGIPQISPGAGGPGLPPQAVLQGLSPLVRPMTQHVRNQEPPSASALPTTRSDELHDGKSKLEVSSRYGGWGGDEDGGPNINGWAADAGPSSQVSEPSEAHSKTPEHEPEVVVPQALTQTPDLAPSPAPSSPTPPPSAPPLPVEYMAGPIHYPSIDTSPARVDYPVFAPQEEPPSLVPEATEEKKSQCVVCWDAPAQGVCIPCGHLAGCMDCLSEIKGKKWGCPVCRAPIQQVVKVYAV